VGLKSVTVAENVTCKTVFIVAFSLCITLNSGLCSGYYLGMYRGNRYMYVNDKQAIKTNNMSEQADERTDQ